MRFLFASILCLGIGGAIYYFVIVQQQGMTAKINVMNSDAQQKAEAYRKTQEDMMKQMEQ